MNNPVSKVIHKCFNRDLDFRVQIFNTLGTLGFGLGLAFGIFCLFVHPEILNVFANFGASAVAAVVIWRANSSGNFKRYFLITVVVVFLLIFPLLFFMGGGYTSGMPCFFVFAVVFTVLMLEGGRRIVFTILELALYSGCFLTAYFRPETVYPFPTEADMAKDIIVGCLVAAFVLAVAIYQHIIVYDRKQKELEKVNDALQGLDRMKTEFLQNISHELKTPLTVMCNYALDTLSELQEESLNVPEMEFNQNRIRSEGERLKRMVSQLLNVTEIEGGQLRIRKEQLSLAALMSRVADANFNTLNENGNQAVLEIPDGLPDITADMDAIEQVLLNMLSNATRHTRQGIITMSLSVGDGWQEVSMSDTGEGMPSDVRNQVFLRYVERESRMTGRSGLGLYICKKYIDAHGGDIGIESEQGKGTTVWFRLPVDGKGGELHE